MASASNVASATIARPQIEAAVALVRAHIRRTPVVDATCADFGFEGSKVNFKLELLQHAGSFKARGAFTNLLSRTVPAAGVVAASGGNHGAAIAYAAMKLGISAKIFVPSVASPAKIEQIRSYGADLTIAGDRYAEALESSEAWIKHSGAMPVHAYDQLETLMGQGTTAMEWEQQCPHLDTVLVSVGGGGLIGGMASWYAGATRVIGVEPEGAPTLYRALEAGQPVDAPAGSVAADSLAPRQVGQLMFPIAQAHAAEVVLVSDDDILHAQQLLWRTLRIVTETGSAAAFAALASGRYRPGADENVGVLLCGANTTAVKFTI